MNAHHTDTEGVTMYLAMAHDTIRKVEVGYLPSTESPDFRVQMFLGSSHHTLYMSVEDARQFAQDILAVLPADRRPAAPLTGAVQA
jgi:hypothetical protein